MNIKDFFVRKNEISKSFFVVNGIFPECTYLFVMDSNNNASLYSYPDIRLLVGNARYSKAYLMDNLPSLKYDLRKDRTMYDECKEYHLFMQMLSDMQSNNWTDDTLDFSITNLYRDVSDEYALNKLNTNIRIFSYVCKKYNISYESNPEVIMKGIIDRLSSFPEDPMLDLNGVTPIDISFCTSEQSIEDFFIKRINECSNERDFRKLSESLYGMMGSSSRLIFDYSGEILKNDFIIKDVFKNKAFKYNKDLIKTYMEFFIVFPYFCRIIQKLEVCSKKAMNIYDQKRYNKFHSNEEFINDMDSITSPEEGMDKGFHACFSSFEANKICNEGLYTYSPNIGSTMYFNFDTDQALYYEYGNGITMCDDAIVVIAVPKNEDIIRELTEEERENVNIAPRRLAISSKPTHVVDPKYIIGYIDKKKQKVVYNPKYNVAIKNENFER